MTTQILKTFDAPKIDMEATYAFIFNGVEFHAHQVSPYRTTEIATAADAQFNGSVMIPDPVNSDRLVTSIELVLRESLSEDQWEDFHEAITDPEYRTSPDQLVSVAKWLIEVQAGVPFGKSQGSKSTVVHDGRVSTPASRSQVTRAGSPLFASPDSAD